MKFLRLKKNIEPLLRNMLVSGNCVAPIIFIEFHCTQISDRSIFFIQFKLIVDKNKILIFISLLDNKEILKIF